MKKFFLILLVSSSVYAAEVGIVKLLKGVVSASIDSNIQNLSVGSILDEKVIIETKENSSVTIVFNDSSVLVLGPNSIINLKKYLFKPKENLYDFQLFLKKGAATFESGDIGKVSPESFIFKTPQGTVSIRGTKFAVKAE